MFKLPFLQLLPLQELRSHLLNSFATQLRSTLSSYLHVQPTSDLQETSRPWPINFRWLLLLVVRTTSMCLGETFRGWSMLKMTSSNLVKNLLLDTNKCKVSTIKLTSTCPPILTQLPHKSTVSFLIGQFHQAVMLMLMLLEMLASKAIPPVSIGDTDGYHSPPRACNISCFVLHLHCSSLELCRFSSVAFTSYWSSGQPSPLFTFQRPMVIMDVRLVDHG